eukprot:m.16841 g.16841  ORF g.16841 m.16841 type:complete len:328 (+) comp4678_c0_seq1:112-1095(+)
MEEQLQKVVATYENAVPNYVTIMDAVEKEDDNLCTEVQAAKEYMSKLKFNYIEMKTKKYFLEKLESFKIGETPTCPIDDETMDAQKERVQKIKADNEALDKDIQVLAQDIISSKNKCENLKSEALSCIENLQAERILLRKAEENASYQNQYLSKEEQLVTQDDVDVMSTKVAELHRRIEHLREQKQSQLEQLKASKQACSDTTNKKDRLQQKLNKCKTAELAELQQNKALFQREVDAFCQSTGTHVETLTDTFVEVKMEVVDSSDGTLSVRHVHMDFEPKTKEISSIVVDGSNAYSKSLLTALSRTSSSSNIRLALAVVRQTLLSNI